MDYIPRTEDPAQCRNLVKKIRTEKGLNQTDLAILAGMQNNKISLIERGSRINQASARKIAAALSVKPEKVFPNFSELRRY